MPYQPVIAGTNGTPDQVVLDFLADMKAVEVWAAARSGGDREPDFAAIRERLLPCANGT